MRYFRRGNKQLRYNINTQICVEYIFTKEHKNRISDSLKKRNYFHSEETRRKISNAHKGIKHNIETKIKLSISHTKNWNGINYGARHKRIDKKLGVPRYCEFCKTTNSRFFDWANVSGEYREDTTDWKRLCRKCHLRWDRKRNNKAFVRFRNSYNNKQRNEP